MAIAVDNGVTYHGSVKLSTCVSLVLMSFGTVMTPARQCRLWVDTVMTPARQCRLWVGFVMIPARQCRLGAM